LLADHITRDEHGPNNQSDLACLLPAAWPDPHQNTTMKN